MNLPTGSFCHPQKLPRTERDSGKGDTNEAFDSVIDEVVLFDFKGFQRGSGLVLALSSLRDPPRPELQAYPCCCEQKL